MNACHKGHSQAELLAKLALADIKLTVFYLTTGSKSCGLYENKICPKWEGDLCVVHCITDWKWTRSVTWVYQLCFVTYVV